MNLTLNENEYRRLMVMTLLGEWVINAIRKEPDLDYEETASKVYEQVKGTPMEELTAFDLNSNTFIPSEEFDEECQAMLDEYDEKTFWEELTGRLVERDLFASHGERAVRSMRPEQRTRIAADIAKAYTKVFEEEGLERLQITE